ncbi:hypothetical protein HDU97_006435 [Phlyctochytrium planicorne]|nr:hypothetical protein HDU97_006435 [Phlyctochytrium planicorne]
MSGLDAFWALIYKNITIFRVKLWTNLSLLFATPRQSLLGNFKTGVGNINPLEFSLDSFKTTKLDSAVRIVAVADDRTLKIPALSEILQGVKNLGGNENFSFYTAASGEKLVTDCSPSLIDLTYAKSCWAGIILADSTNQADGPRKWNYTVYYPDSIFPKRINVNEGQGAFADRGLLQLQILLDKALMRLSAKEINMPATALNAWDAAPLTNAQISTRLLSQVLQQLYDVLKGQASIFFLMGFFPHMFWLINNILLEKELSIKDSMSMMGLRPWMYLTSWLIVAGAISALSFALVAVIMHFAVFPFSNLILTILFIVISGLELLSFGLTASTFLVKARMSGLIVNSITFALGIVGVVISNLPASSGLRSIASILFPPTTLVFGTILLCEAESTNGIDFSSMSTPSPSQGISFLTLLILGGIGIVFHVLAAWLLEKGFIMLARISSKGSGKVDGNAGPHAFNDNPQLKPGLYEPEQTGTPISISIRGLTKQFPGSHTVSVKSLSLDMHEGQVFCLLGRNGCGKSTTIGMLSGLIAPTAGTATIHGKSIASDMNEIRHSLGVCPQHDILWDNLTVFQTLQVYAGIKGIPGSIKTQEIEKWLNIVGIPEKRNAKVMSLSGGQKRKVSLCIAFMGDSKIVFLDEPTAGVDPFSRRAMWKVIMDNKAGRTIVLTTHFLDEADILGDRVAIMDLGCLKAAGSSLFLKRTFGVGYILNLTMNPASPNPERELTRIRQLIQEAIPAATNTVPGPSELVYNIPLTENASLVSLLRNLETDKGAILDFGLSMVTLDDVFLKLIDPDYHENGPVPTPNYSLKYSASFPEIIPEHDWKHMDESVIEMEQVGASSSQTKQENCDVRFVKPGRVSFIAQFMALLRKRYLLSRRDLRFSLVPVIFILAACIIMYLTTKNQPAMTCPTSRIDFGQSVPISAIYSVSSTLIEKEKSLSFVGDSFTANIASSLVPTTNSPDGPTLPRFNVSTAIQSFEGFSRLLSSNPEIFITLAGGVFLDRRSTDGIILGATIVHDENKNYSTPLVANLLSNIVWSIASSTGQSVTGQKLIDTTWKPFPKPALVLDNGDWNGFLMIVVFGFIGYTICMCLLSIIWLVRERELRVRDQQRFSGVSSVTYWLSNITWDGVQVLVFALAISSILAALQTWKASFIITFLTFALTGLVLCMYAGVFSFWFRQPSTALMAYIGTLIVVGYFSFIAWINIFALAQDVADPFEKADIVAFSAMINPSYPLLHAVILGSNFVFIQCKDNYELDSSKLFEWKFFGRILIVQCGHLVLAAILIAFQEILPKLVLLFRQLRSGNAMAPVVLNKDQDVYSEEHFVLNGPPQGYNGPANTIAFKNLHKEFKLKKKHKMTAVKNLSYGVREKECFVLLGTNGAGKTTTLKMACGQELPTSGDIIVKNESLVSNVQKVQKNIGVCPQFDSLWPSLTVVEHMELFCAFRGVPARAQKEVIRYLLRSLDLERFSNQVSQALSGGNRRKLALAIALIGAPDLLILDECSTGMDPASKRKMWKVILDLGSQLSMILTTHSMEEAEALAGQHRNLPASRIGIMVSGGLSALGTKRRLQEQHGRAYQIQAKCTSQEWSNHFANTIQQCLPLVRIQVLERHLGTVRLEVDRFYQGGAEIKLSELFDIVENIKRDCCVVDYQIGNTSLEQIFLQFASAGYNPNA